MIGVLDAREAPAHDEAMGGLGIIDLRSDTVTRPGPGMREAMARAEVGDDVYGEDPTVNALEERSASLAGKEAGLFVPSGSQANLISLLTHVPRGEEVIVGEESHCVRFEAGSGAVIGGVQWSVIPGDGRFTAGEVRARIRERTLHSPGTALVWVENTHNMGGGRVFPLDEMHRIRDLCREKGIPVHLDGARIWNASAATGRSVAEWAAPVDSLSFCLSKGLGAPVGSVLMGSRDFVDRARRFRKMLGGAMRQAGVIAAAGLYALDHNVGRISEDHESARLLAEGLRGIAGLEVDGAVETNIVMGRTSTMEARLLAEACRARSVLFHALGERLVRFVTHLDVSREMVGCAVLRIRETLGA